MTAKPSIEKLEKKILKLERELSESELAKEVLQEAKSEYQDLFDNMMVGIIISTLQGEIVGANRAMSALSGYSHKEILNLKAEDVYLHPEDRLQVIEKLIQKGFVKDYEVQLKKKNGQGYWASFTTNKIIHDGKVAFLSSIIEINIRKQYEEGLKKIALEEPYQFGQDFFDAIVIKLIEILDADYTFIGELTSDQKTIRTISLCINGEIKDNFEYDLLHTPCENVVGVSVCSYENNVAKLFPQDLLLEQMDVKGYVGVPLFNKNNKPTGIIVALYRTKVKNIKFAESFLQLVASRAAAEMERTYIEQALRAGEEKFRRIFDNLQDGYLWADSDGNILLANMVAASILGYDLKELMQKNMAQDIYFSPEDREIVKKIMAQNGKIKNSELTFKRKDGQKIIVEANSHIVHDDNLQSTMEGTFRDITSRKQTEAEKLIAQKIADNHSKQALVGQIAGKMAHDFNNILGIIMGNTELAMIDCPHSQTRKTLELIFEQTIRGKNLTKNLVAFAKDQEPKQEFFRISEKIDLVLNLMRKDLEGIELQKEESPDVPELLADPGMIEHALVNLIQNSIHAISMNESPRIIVRTYSLDNKVCFEIEDNGCGILKEDLENIYDPSFTLKGSKDVADSYKSGIKGTGYGMSNVKKYIEQHKGNISVESELGLGTKFIISLPVIKKELTIEEKIELQEEIKHFEKYILLVEDETAISNVQYRILTDEPCNHKIDIANTGKIAMDLFDRNEYDFVSLDYVLPGGINGMDFYHHIRETNKTIPILFVSGNIEFLESIKNLKQQDAYIDHLSKPCQNKDYVNGINELLEKTLAEQ